MGNEVLEVLAGAMPAAFATDSRDRVVFWNEGAATLLGRRAEEVMGRHCYEVLGGRDISGEGGDPATFHCTFLRLPGPRGDLFVLVPVLDPVDAHGRPPRVPAPRLREGDGARVLSRREREILEWVAAGLQNKEIAQRLELSLATVRNHVHHTLKKLQVHSKLEAVSLAFRMRWVTGDGPASTLPR